MGGSKGSSTTVVSGGSSTSSREVTPEERELNQLEINRQKAIDPYLTAVQQQGLGLSSILLGGGQLPGNLAGLSQGLSPDVQNSIVQESLRAISPQFQKYGLLDSGTNIATQARVAGDIYRGSAEYNLGNQLNLLNLALGGQAQVQQPVLGFSSLLSQRLGSAGTQTSTWNQNQTTTYPRQRMFGLF